MPVPRPLRLLLESRLTLPAAAVAAMLLNLLSPFAGLLAAYALLAACCVRLLCIGRLRAWSAVLLIALGEGLELWRGDAAPASGYALVQALLGLGLVLLLAQALFAQVRLPARP